MVSRSTTQLAFDYDARESEAGPASAHQQPTTAAEFKVPTFEGYGEVYAAAARRAGRLNAATVSDTERDSLLLERQLLLDRKFNGTITRKESNRLEYVRWSLDRIEDARHGWAMDALEHSVAGYEQFSNDVKSLLGQLADLQKKK